MDESSVRDRMLEAGFALVQTAPRISGPRGERPDAVAWASNADGELVPWAVVEVKSLRAPATPEMFLPQLLHYRELLGTVEHYVVLNGEWFRADRGLRTLERVSGPAAPMYGSTGELCDASLVESLLMERLWAGVDRARARGKVTEVLPEVVAQVIADAARYGVQTQSGLLPIHRDVLFRAARRITNGAAARFRGPFPVGDALSGAMAALVGHKLAGKVIDPFVGSGSLLWAVADRASDSATVELVGVAPDAESSVIVEAVAQAAPVPVTIERRSNWLGPLPQADVVIGAAPFGVRLNEGHTLLDGSSTRDFELAVVDNVVRCLKPNARAVLLLPSSFTFRQSGDAYRRFLATEFRVAALIGLRNALEPHTSIQTVLMVVDRSAHGETFVAQLEKDWKTQLAPGGAAVEAALAHIDGTGDTQQ